MVSIKLGVGEVPISPWLVQVTPTDSAQETQQGCHPRFFLPLAPWERRLGSYFTYVTYPCQSLCGLCLVCLFLIIYFKIKNAYFILCVQMFHQHECSPHAHLLDPLGLGLWMVVSRHVGAGNRTWFTARTASAFNC